MELTPDIVSRSTGHSQFADPWFDPDHDGDVASKNGVGQGAPPSATATMPPRSPPRPIPPTFDSTFAMPLPQSGVATRSPAPVAMPEAARRRGGADTLMSATWFHDASDAAEWRAVAEERRKGAVTTGPRTLPVWIIAAVVASLVMLGTALVGIVTIGVSALVLLS